jgi:hypothetical protein
LFVDIEVELVEDSTDEVGAQQIDFLTFGPEPSVTLPPTGGAVGEEIFDVDESVELLSLTAGLVIAASEGDLGPDGFATAESTVTEVELAEQILPTGVSVQQLEDPILAAQLISATCSPNTSFQIGIVNGISATIGVTLNRQVQNPDGSLSVTALALDIDIDLGFATITGTVEVGPATCGVVEGSIAPPAPAPAPAPVVTVTPRFTG